MKESLSVAPQKETLEDTNMLSYEDFKYNPEGETPQEKQPFNNFYFYFLDEDAGGMFYDIYREKESKRSWTSTACLLKNEPTSYCDFLSKRLSRGGIAKASINSANQ